MTRGATHVPGSVSSIIPVAEDVFLVDRNKWAAGKVLHFDLGELMSRRQAPAMRAMAGLLHREALLPEGGQSLLDVLSRQKREAVSYRAGTWHDPPPVRERIRSRSTSSTSAPRRPNILLRRSAGRTDFLPARSGDSPPTRRLQDRNA